MQPRVRRSAQLGVRHQQGIEEARQIFFAESHGLFSQARPFILRRRHHFGVRAANTRHQQIAEMANRFTAEMLQARDPMERVRTVLNQVVGQPLRVCVKLDSSRAAAHAGRSSELRARFEEDPIVRAMLEKFGGQISNVKRPGEE